jgi:uncharacterized protein (TIGR00288 family)
MKSHRTGEGERSLAVFIDFENMGLGFNNRRDRFEITKVLERLVEKGKIVAKKAYADWSRFGMYTGGLHEAAIELVEIPRRGMSGKNSADIRLVVDAIDLAYSKDHIDTFVIVSGDSDFSPLVSKLKELGKHVIGLGLADATSDLLRDNCDEFIYYEDLDRAPIIPVAMNDSIPDKKRKVFAILLDSLLALRRENKEIIYSSMLKDTIKRKKPSFNEGYYGYRTFSELLEDAERDGLLELEKHKSSGMYVVARFGLELKSGPPAPMPARIVQLPPRNGNEPKKVIELPPRNGNEPKKVIELPPRNGNDPKRVVELPSRIGNEQKRVVEISSRVGEETPDPPKPIAVVEQRLVAPISKPPISHDARASDDPAPADDRPLGRALVDDFDVLDDEPLDEIPSYAPKKTEVKPVAAKPAKPAGGRGGARAPRKAVEKPRDNLPVKAREAAQSAIEPDPKPIGEESALAKPPRGSRVIKEVPPTKAKVAEPPPSGRLEVKPTPPSEDDEFGAGL